MDTKSNNSMKYNPNILDDIPARLAEIDRNKPQNVVISIIEINDIRVPNDFRGISF